MSDDEKKKQEQAIARRNEMPLAMTESGVFRIQPRNFEDYWRLCAALAESDMVPDAYKSKPGNVLVAMEYGASVGIPNIQACQVIAVINGRPGLWGDGFLGVIQRSPEYEWHREDFDEKNQEWTCTIKRRGNDQPFVGKFSKKDAETVKVWHKGGQIRLIDKPGPWKDGYWKRMCQYRARGFAGHDGFADVLRGLQPAEVLRDLETIDADFSVETNEDRFTDMPTATDSEPVEAETVTPGDIDKPQGDDLGPEPELEEPAPPPDHDDPLEQATRRADDFEEAFKACQKDAELLKLRVEYFRFLDSLKDYGFTELWRATFAVWTQHKKRLGVK